MCERQYTSKYANRPGPAYPANKCCNKMMIGNDSEKYMSVPNVNGICAFRKCSFKPIKSLCDDYENNNLGQNPTYMPQQRSIQMKQKPVQMKQKPVQMKQKSIQMKQKPVQMMQVDQPNEPMYKTKSTGVCHCMTKAGTPCKLKPSQNEKMCWRHKDCEKSF